ncbi:hypothetical protein [Dyadobacter sp. NIV53]|uniref:hypothetical protein n=1 Tax=Dyadobacter sp. NIV53 TaxID=2861765 RepID=UPI001C870AD0|nr:hypothetical protein [Dyadobacter sp. NIV53]
MILSVRILKNSAWVIQALLFFKNHLSVILGLGLIAAFGRAAQLGAFGPVTSFYHYLLEIIIQSARISIFIYTLGLTNLKMGVVRLKKILSDKNTWQEHGKIAVRKIKKEWVSLLTSFVIYLIIAFIINSLINFATYQTCLYFKLKTSEIISDKASEWVIILFLKNISVIPFSLVFNAVFLLWITNKMKPVSFNN